ncbi:hypothetical protein O9992_21775 [Vibrio lentus]|nr:hypothetical protein [Vibrio lentus]
MYRYVDGAMSLMHRLQEYPDVAMDTVEIETSYPGADGSRHWNST